MIRPTKGPEDIKARREERSQKLRLVSTSTYPKRAWKWLGGIALATLAAVITSGLTGLKTYIPSLENVRCLYETSASKIESSDKLVLLISRLSNDPDGNETRTLVSYFRGQKGFEVVPLCTSLAIRPNGAQSAAEKSAIMAGRRMLQDKRGDLLIWGEVNKKTRALTLWFINESGECDVSPRAYRFAESADKAFVSKFGEQLIGDAVQTSSATCVAREYRNAERMREVARKLSTVARESSEDWLTYPANYHASFFAGQAYGVAYFASAKPEDADAALTHYSSALKIAEGSPSHVGWAQCMDSIATVMSQRGSNEKSVNATADAISQYELLQQRNPVVTDAMYDDDQYDAMLVNYLSTIDDLYEYEGQDKSKIAEQYRPVLAALDQRAAKSPPLKKAMDGVRKKFEAVTAKRAKGASG